MAARGRAMCHLGDTTLAWGLFLALSLDYDIDEMIMDEM